MPNATMPPIPVSARPPSSAAATSNGLSHPSSRPTRRSDHDRADYQHRHERPDRAVYIAPLETDLFDREDDALLSRDILPATHPPTDERVDRLTEMGAERHTQ